MPAGKGDINGSGVSSDKILIIDCGVFPKDELLKREGKGDVGGGIAGVDSSERYRY